MKAICEKTKVLQLPPWLGYLVNRYRVSVCNHNPILSSFVTCHRVCNKSNTAGATCRAGTIYCSRAPERGLVFCVIFCRSLFILWFTTSDYPFGTFWLPLWYLLITPLVPSDYPFGIFWLPLWYLLITPLVSSDYPFGIIWLPLWYLLIIPLVSSDYLFGIFWLPLWYLQTFLYLWKYQS